MLPWRNWLARSTVNRKVGGSNPPGSDLYENNMKNRNRTKMTWIVVAKVMPLFPNKIATYLAEIKKDKNVPKSSLPGGLEPPTFRLTVERANQLRHGSTRFGKFIFDVEFHNK